MRTACYARYSSDLQRQTSLDDQIRSCRDYATQQGWAWQETHVYRDAGVSGASMEGRTGLLALLAASEQQPRPFDVLLVDDSSRLARDLADALRISQGLQYAGVRVVYISQGIDSASEEHETLITVHGLVDAMFRREMAAKIKRGLRGQVTRGFATGGRTYGYRSVPVPDPARPGESAGYRFEVVPDEARTVRAIFQWYGEGATVPTIFARLRQGPYPAPRGGTWRLGAIQRVLRNPKYRGRLVWGRTQQIRKPGSRKKTSRPQPPDRWVQLERPELRIVSEEAWQRAQTRRRETDQRLNATRQPGRTLLRGRHSAVHSHTLFSGFMDCEVCGRAVNVVSNRPYKGRRYPYYGCSHASRNGPAACANRVKVRMEAADRALLAGLQAELLRPETVRYICERLNQALQAALDQRPAERDAVRRDHDRVATALKHLVAAVEAGSTSPSLLTALSAREAELGALQARLTALDTPCRTRTPVIPTWVKAQLKDVADLLGDAPERARAEFQRLGIRFTIRPVYDEGKRPFLRAEGSGDFLQIALQGTTDFPASGSSGGVDVEDLALQREALALRFERLQPRQVGLLRWSGQKEEMQMLRPVLGFRVRIARGRALEFLARQHHHPRRESVALRHGGRGEGRQAVRLRDRAPADDIAAVDVGVHVGTADSLERPSQLLHRQHVAAAHVDAAKQGDVGGHARGIFGDTCHEIQGSGLWRCSSAGSSRVRPSGSGTRRLEIEEAYAARRRRRTRRP